MPVAPEYPKVYLYRRIVQAKRYIDTHFAEPINLDDIADEAYFSKFHFIRLFRKAYGKSPHQYLIAVRIFQAVQLLMAARTVGEVCHRVGFDSISTFTGLFKKITGETPAAYQQRILARQAELSENPLAFIPGCFAGKNGWTELAILKKGSHAATLHLSENEQNI